MNRHHRHNRPSNPRDEYVCRFYAALRRSLCARRERNVDDIVAAETLRLLRKFEKVVATYADPEVYARVRSTAARAEHYRNDNKQRAAGAHFRKDDEGRVVRGREVVSGDAPVGEGGAAFFDGVVDRSPSVEDLVVSAQHAEWLFDVVRAEAGAADAATFEHGVRNDRNDIETAADFGITRETANRRKQRAVRSVKGRFSADNVE